MATLAASLALLFREIDNRWPNRDRRTDGWYADPRVRTSVGHNPDPWGNVHAIDVDRDGIDPLWIINNIHRTGGVLRYIIWDRRVWHTITGWTGYRYTGSNPHTDHMHIEINQTFAARTYLLGWNIAVPGKGGFGPAPKDAISLTQSWEYRQHIDAANGRFTETANSARHHGRAIADLRR